MSTDRKVTEELIETLEDGKLGYAAAADRLDGDGSPDMAAKFRQFSGEREQFANELRGLAADYGDDVDESGTVTAAVHRGWIKLKDALTGSDPSAVLGATETGEDHAVAEYEKALGEDISPTLRSVVERQHAAISAARDEVRKMRAAA